MGFDSGFKGLIATVDWDEWSATQPGNFTFRKERQVSKLSLFWDVTRPRLVVGYRSFWKLIGPAIFEDGTERFSRNIGNQPPNYAAAEDWKGTTPGTSGKVKILSLPWTELRFARRSARGTVIVMSEFISVHERGCKSNFIYFRNFLFLGSV